MPRAARSCYAELPDGPAAAGAAAAVHAVALQLRDRYPRRPDVWAALIHAGP